MEPQRVGESIELRCIQSADKTLLRFIPLLILFGVCVLILAGIVFSLLMQSNLELATVLAVVAAVTIPAMMYIRRRGRLRHEYTHQKRLILAPAGLRRVDATTDLQMPWSGVQGITVTDNVVMNGVHIPIAGPVRGQVQEGRFLGSHRHAEAICGGAVIAPADGASKSSVKILDLRTGSRLAEGELASTRSGIIFPSEFEQDWRRGTIGTWLRHYRPDLRLD